MNVHFSYKTAKTPDVVREVEQQIEKLGRRLQVFRPELIHLHGGVGPGSAKEGAIHVTLNLRLPSGQLAAQNTAANAVAAVKGSFHELLNQLNAHKDLLRNKHKWRRLSREYDRVPFEKTIAAVGPDGNTPDLNATPELRDVQQFVNSDLPRLTRFIARELRYRESTGAIQPNQVTTEEVVDEAVAMALSGEEHRPETLSVQRWIYRLALKALTNLTRPNGEADITAVRIEQSAGEQNVTGSDEAVLQFHQPDDRLTEENVIANPNANSPEQLAQSDEFIAQLELALREGRAEEREAFILFALEGFTPDEIAKISDRSPDEVKKLIANARGTIEKRLPNSNAFKSRLLNYDVA